MALISSSSELKSNRIAYADQEASAAARHPYLYLNRASHPRRPVNDHQTRCRTLLTAFRFSKSSAAASERADISVATMRPSQARVRNGSRKRGTRHRPAPRQSHPLLITEQGDTPLRPHKTGLCSGFISPRFGLCARGRRHQSEGFVPGRPVTRQNRAPGTGDFLSMMYEQNK